MNVPTRLVHVAARRLHEDECDGEYTDCAFRGDHEEDGGRVIAAVFAECEVVEEVRFHIKATGESSEWASSFRRLGDWAAFGVAPAVRERRLVITTPPWEGEGE